MKALDIGLSGFDTDSLSPVRKISKADRLIVIALTVMAFFFLFRPLIATMNLWRGAQYIEARQLRDAARSFRKALILDPGNANAHDSLGLIAHSLGHREEEIEHYEEAIRLAPDNADYHFNLSVVRLRKQEYARALPHMREAVRLAPDDLGRRRTLASIYQKLGQERRAQAVLDRVKELAETRSR